jgi:hypothetical protein
MNALRTQNFAALKTTIYATENDPEVISVSNTISILEIVYNDVESQQSKSGFYQKAHLEEIVELMGALDVLENVPSREALTQIFNRSRLSYQLVDLRWNCECYIGVKVTTCKCH